MIRKQHHTVLAVLATAFLAVSALAGEPVGTAFTYQGKLTDQGRRSGPHDLAFSLWDELGSGVQIGTTQTINGVPVQDGLFNVELDFGASVFDGDARWLEISVGGFVLSPRQPVTPSPYSIQTRGIFVDQDLNVGLGTASPAADLDIVDDDTNVRVLATTTDGPHVQLQSTYTGVATAALGSLDFVNSDWDTKASVTALQTLFGTRLHLTTEGVDRLSIDQSGNVGIGTPLPFSTLHIDSANGVLTNFALHKDDIVLDDTGGDEAVLGLYSNDIGPNGSALTFGELFYSNGFLRNKWAMFRETTLNGSRLKFSFGPNNDHTLNPTVLCLSETGGIEFPDGTVQATAPGTGISDHEYRNAGFDPTPIPSNVYTFVTGTVVLTVTAPGQRIHVVSTVQISCNDGLDDCAVARFGIAYRPAGAGGEPTLAGATLLTEPEQDYQTVTRHVIIEDLAPGQYEIGMAAGVINFVQDDDLVYSGGDTTAFVF